MKLTRAANDGFRLHLGHWEKELLLKLTRPYPRLAPRHQKLSKSAVVPDHAASQQLLEESLAEHQVANRKQLAALLKADRLEPTKAGWRLSVSSAEVEALLQVLNDIRVGSWVRLGSPEQGCEVLNAQTAPDLWAMEMAGILQARLLAALDGG